MSTNKIPLTRSGMAALKLELKRLKSVERPRVIEDISIARGHGDLSENADYAAAKERQSFIEGRIQELEDKISRADVVDVSKLSGDRVLFGATVELSDEDGNKSTYRIVGDIEADLKKGRIAVQSPIARALIGREVGDSVTVKGPKGAEKEYEILSVAFKEEPETAEEA
jgi:transcription elongation factor GreA